MATPVEAALRRAVADLNALKARWALVGGLAISVRSVPRFTKDLDFAVAVAGDPEAEDVVHRLGGRGYRPVEVLEQEYVERMSGVRLERGGSDVVVDLLFASSGIEGEVVAGATRLEVLPQLTAPVATTGHDVCIHRWGWQVILHPDGTIEARSPDGSQTLKSHAPPSPKTD
jgi:hypothetical protein